MKSRFTFNRILPLVCFAFLISLSTLAQQRKKISLQGLLKDGSGKAVANGTYNATFRLYTTSAGGEAKWSEEQQITTRGGLYSAYIGVKKSLDSSVLDWGKNTYFVGVTIEGNELAPRTELTFAPYSLGSPEAEVAKTVRCSGAVGDVKYSILNPTKFAEVNGDCWVPMDGRNINGSKLATIMEMTSLPDAGGMFLRGQEFATSPNHDPDRNSQSPIASFQDQSFLAHNHAGTTTNNGNHSHTYQDWYANNTQKQYSNGFEPRYNSNMIDSTGEASESTNSAGEHSHTLNINNSGGPETRPKNLNLWTYIRIN